MNLYFININCLYIHLEHTVHVCAGCIIYWIYRWCLVCICVCKFFVLTPNSYSSGQSSEAHKVATSHFSHITQEMNIQTKTLTWLFTFEHFQEGAYFSKIPFKIPAVLYNNRKLGSYFILLPPIWATLTSYLRYLLTVTYRHPTKSIY